MLDVSSHVGNRAAATRMARPVGSETPGTYPTTEQQLAAVDLRAANLAQLSFTPNQIVSPVPVGSEIAAGTAKLVAAALGRPVPREVRFPVGDMTYTTLPLTSLTTTAPTRIHMPSTREALAADQPGTALTSATASVLRATASSTPGVVIVDSGAEAQVS
jgi:hypothetical protein